MSLLKYSLPSAKNGGGIYREYEVSPTANDFSSAPRHRRHESSVLLYGLPRSKDFSLPKNGPEPALPGSDLLRDVEEKLGAGATSRSEQRRDHRARCRMSYTMIPRKM